MGKNIVLTSLIISLSCLIISPAASITNNHEEIKIPTNYNNEMVDTYTDKDLQYKGINIDGWYNVFKVGFKIADYVSGALNTSSNSSIFHDTTGNFTYALQTMKYNNYGNSRQGTTAYKEVKATETGQEIAIWASPESLFTQKLALSLRRSDKQVLISKVVTGADIYTYKIPNSGVGYKYEAEYTSTEKTAWNLSLRFAHYTADRYGVKPSSFIDEKVNGVVYTPINNKVYIKPNEEIIKSNRFSEFKIPTKDIMTFKELRDEFFYEEINAYTNIAKNLKANDEIYMVDEIKDIYYNNETKETSIGFEFGNKNQLEYITFKDDLTKKYKRGDQIKLKFRVLPVEDTEYVILDYNYMFELENKAPRINKFVVDNNEN